MRGGARPDAHRARRLNFSFVYVPYTATRLIGGQINGTTGATIHKGLGAYTLTRIGTGRYSLVIPNKNDANGGLVLSPIGLMAGTGDLPDRTFFSYEYDSANGRFIIESREIIPDSNTPWNRTPTLRDSDFQFVWVDYVRPLSPTTCIGDLNGDGEVSLGDLAVLLAHFGNASGAGVADGNIEGNDGDVDIGDLALLLAHFGQVCP